VYYLPLGLSLPAGTRPACNQCLQNTMAIFANTASNSTSALSGDYGQAAQMIDVSCGPKFVEPNVVVEGGAGALGLHMAWVFAVVFSVLILLFWC